MENKKKINKKIVWIKYHIKEKTCDVCYKYEFTKGFIKHEVITGYKFKGNFKEKNLINWFDKKYNNIHNNANLFITLYNNIKKFFIYVFKKIIN